MDACKKIGPEIRKTSNVIKACVDRQCASNLEVHLTGIEGMTIGYICEQNREVSTSELKTVFKIGKASLSEGLSTLARKGFITMQASPKDHRKKIIAITPKGLEAHNAFKKNLDKVSIKLANNITEEELEAFFKTLAIIQKNAESL